MATTTYPPTEVSRSKSKPGLLSGLLNDRPVLGAVGVLALLLVWEIAPRLGLINPYWFPPLSDVVPALGALLIDPEFWLALGQTISGWAIGLAIVTVAGIAIGMVIGSIGWLREFTSSTIEFLRPIPSVALIPLAVLMYGTSPMATRLMILYSCFWPILLQTIQGVQDVDPVARDTARSFRFGPLTTFRKLVWPSALPYIVTGFRLAASLAFIVEITGELIIGSPGIGRNIVEAQWSGAVDRLYAYVIVAGALGMVVNLVVRQFESRVLRWHASVRIESAA